MQKPYALIFTLLVTSHVCFAQHKKFADSIRQASSIPELAYAVVTSKETKEINWLGTHSIELSDPATATDRFHIGSNTKAMTAFIIAKYVEQKKLSWNDKFFDLFPDWKSQSRPEYFNITLQDLLSHRAAIQPFQGFDDPEIPAFTGSKQQQRASFGKFVLTLPPAKKDSTQSFVYSNADYSLAALMLEKQTGLSWEDLVEKVFNTDLHLNVKLSWPENQTASDTWGHYVENGKLTPAPSTLEYRLDLTEPAGDMNIRLTDYIKFIQLNLQGLEGKNNYLKADTYNFLHRGVADYSIGWYNIYEADQELSSHSGTAGTYYSLVHIDRKRKIAYIIFTNAFSNDVKTGVRDLMRKLKADYGR